MRLSDFDFPLPDHLIAQQPSAQRGASRLLVVDRTTGTWTNRAVADLPDLLAPSDLLVVNNSRVVPARLLGRREPSGG
ncbi:MAG: S-adenosylmethionine:tRNA ribosyltransferase-isomerase, partial [Vicinamibacteria bacterium]|nr:S-adenosylmethionine:tRNA ribosyltransferase-isomerase [Vicinamibacteria bacterium]